MEKGGEIIPKVVSIDFSQRDPLLRPTVFISDCPECDTELTRREGDAKHYCMNSNHCPPQIVGRFEHFISRKAMNIDGLGSETIELLVKEGLIKDFSDLYLLRKEQLIPLERIAEKSADNLIISINQSKNIPFDRVLFALGIRFVGETVAKKLAKHYISIHNIMNATFEDLIEVDEIGEKIAEAVVDYFKDYSNRELISKLISFDLCFLLDTQDVGLSEKLKGKSVVVSGVFDKYSRKELKDLIEKAEASGNGVLFDEAYEFFHTPPISSLQFVNDINKMPYAS